MEDTEILLPEKKEIVVGTRKYCIGRLSLKQGFRLSKFIANTVLVSQDKLKIIADKTKDSKSNVSDIMTILDLLTEEEGAKFYAIILCEEDTEYILQHLDLVKGLEIIADVVEFNKDLKKNILRIMNLFKKKEVAEITAVKTS